MVTAYMKKKSPKQIVALVCAALLVALYVITFIVACLDIADSGKLFSICLSATIGVPIFLWIILFFLGRMN